MPPWARRAAILAVLTPLPSAGWRMSMALGAPLGVRDEVRAHYAFPSWGTAYVAGLSVLLVGLALLTFGLVSGWGEVVPAWVPRMGGRRVAPLAAVIPAGAGAAALTVLWVGVFTSLGEIWDLYGLDGAARSLMVACYAPLLLWGPLLGAVTVSYAKRHARRAHAADGPWCLVGKTGDRPPP